MFESLESILMTALIQQELPAGATAPPWVEYVVYGVVGLVVLILIIKGLKPGEAPPPLIVDEPQLVEKVEQTDAEIEAQARKAFHVSQVSVDESGQTQVRITRDEAEVYRHVSAEPEPKVEVPEPKVEVPEPKVEVPEPKVEAPEPEPVEEAPKIEAAGKTLSEGLQRTREGFIGKLGKLFGSAKTIDDDLLGDLEEALFTADIGVRTSQRLVDMVHDGMSKKALKDPAKVWAQIKAEICQILLIDSEPLDLDRAKPLVVMVVGVNGAGKTTSIGKLAKRYTDQGKKVMLAAGDTFRAAAVEQLEVWGERAGVPVVRGKQGQDPSSVIFDACKRAQDEDIDILFADTAGRLQARKELMDELAKVHRVIGKASPGAPHEVWLVLDSTNGQNAISQAKEFRKVVDVTGIVLTKLDGTAKGGVVIGISDEMKLPVRYIGIGEQAEDLQEFDPEAFADALFEDS